MTAFHGMRRALVALAFAVPLAAIGADRGATIASSGNGNGAPPCASCHGPDGGGNAAAGYPRLAGLPAEYLAAQLHAFADGRRVNAVMKPTASALSDADIAAVTEHYAQMTPPAGDGGNPGEHPLGRRIARNGLWGQGVPACTTCHGRRGRGVGDVFPPLAGQPASYLRDQILAWQSGDRHDDPHGLMASVAGRLTADQAAAVADYFAALPATRQ